ncbi:MAG: hypothetical protein U0263_02005 [Polyangiaceae bacterium]
MRRVGLAVLGLLTIAMGCATAESIDDDQSFGGVPIDAGGKGGKGDGVGGTGSNNAGGTSAGGSAGEPGGGGTTAGGGTSGGGTSGGGTSGGGTSGGGTSGGGSGGGSTCGTGKKSCGGVCVAPSPGIGCGLVDNQCAACPNPPANGTSSCNGNLCDFVCNAGFAKQGNACISTGGGGAPSGGGGGGGGGVGGGSGCPAPCNPSDVTSQFLCTFYCATQTNKPGLCLPVINCCTCPT